MKDEEETRLLADEREDLTEHFEKQGEASRDRVLFLKQHAKDSIRILGTEKKGSYSGKVFALLETDDHYVLWCDYFGSCAVCDEFVDEYDFEDVKGSEKRLWPLFMRTLEAGHTKQFDSLEDIEEWIGKTPDTMWSDDSYHVRRLLMEEDDGS